jgi:hypothetical protein
MAQQEEIPWLLLLLLLSTPTTAQKLEGRKKTLCLNIPCRNRSDIIQWTEVSTLQNFTWRTSMCECKLLQICQKSVTCGIFSICIIWVLFFIKFYLHYVFASSAGSLYLAGKLESRGIQFFPMTSITLPLTVLHRILLGALKWYGPLAGFTLHLLRRNERYFSLALKIHHFSYSVTVPVKLT